MARRVRAERIGPCVASGAKRRLVDRKDRVGVFDFRLVFDAASDRPVSPRLAFKNDFQKVRVNRKARASIELYVRGRLRGRYLRSIDLRCRWVRSASARANILAREPNEIRSISQFKNGKGVAICCQRLS